MDEMAHKLYGIKNINTVLRDVDSTIASFSAMPSTVRKGVIRGMQQITELVKAQAKLLVPPEHPEIRNAIMSEVTETAEGIRGTVYVDAAPYGNVPMPVFIEMGTGPKGRDNPGKRYPLPSSAYTQEPWFYFDTSLNKFVKSSGMVPSPYLWPAIQIVEPRAAEIMRKAIGDAIREDKGVT